MPIHWLDYSIIILYFFVIVYIGWWSMQKVSSFDDYAVAGRGMPLAIFFAAIAATLCGGGATIGRVAYMHTTGVVVFAGLMGVVINQIISGLCIAGRVHSIPNVYTVGDLCGMYYGRAGRLVSSVVCFLFCLGLFGVQILAMGAILQTATGIDLIPAALISSAITLAYTWAGGMLGVTMTDAIQYVIIVVGVSLCGYLGIERAGGYDAMIAQLQSMPQYVNNLKPFADWGVIQFAGLFFGFSGRLFQVICLHNGTPSGDLTVIFCSFYTVGQNSICFQDFLHLLRGINAVFKIGVRMKPLSQSIFGGSDLFRGSFDRNSQYVIVVLIFHLISPLMMIPLNIITIVRQIGLEINSWLQMVSFRNILIKKGTL